MMCNEIDLDQPLTYHMDLSKVRRELDRRAYVNVGNTERIASGVVGGALIALGLWKRQLSGSALLLLGGVLLHRGSSGHCSLYAKAGMNRQVA